VTYWATHVLHLNIKQ